MLYLSKLVIRGSSWGRGFRFHRSEASFDTFMAQHDGSNNAYTEQEKTVFYNEIGNAGFDEGVQSYTSKGI